MVFYRHKECPKQIEVMQVTGALGNQSLPGRQGVLVDAIPSDRKTACKKIRYLDGDERFGANYDESYTADQRLKGDDPCGKGSE